MRRPRLAAAATTLTAAAVLAAPVAAAQAAETWPTPRAPRWARQVALDTAISGDRALATAATRTLTTSSVTNATVGVAVRDMATGRLVHVRNPHAPLLPASTAKNRTVAAALSLLGPGYTWHTDVLARGTVTDGALSGPLVVKGHGDPTLLQSDLAGLARQVRAAGITSVPGILTDDTWFDSVRRHPTWSSGDFTEYYAAPISALTMAPDGDHDLATVIVTYAPGSVGGPAVVSTVPAAARQYLTVVNRATTGAAGTGDSVWVSQPVDSGTITVGGSIASGLSQRKVWKIAPSPQMYVAAVFRDELRKAGVTVTGGANPGAATAGDRLVARDRSLPLSQAIVPLLKLSNNPMAETVLKTISAQAGGGGTWPDGAARVTRWMTSAGVPMDGVRVVDGSGLSRGNRETVMSEAGALWAMRRSTAFDTALPVAANPDRMVGGTLRNRMVSTVAAGRVHAKTGTLTGVTALSGYVTTVGGRRLSMTMLSQYSATSPRPVENALGVTLAGWNGTATTSSSGSATTSSRSTTSATDSGAGSSSPSSEWGKRTR